MHSRGRRKGGEIIMCNIIRKCACKPTHTHIHTDDDDEVKENIRKSIFFYDLSADVCADCLDIIV